MRKSIGAAVPPMDFLIRRHRPFYRKGRQIRWNYRKRKRTGQNRKQICRIRKKHCLPNLTRLQTSISFGFSGGVDSSPLLKLVMDASAKYGTKVYAVTFQTRLHPPCDLETATRVAKEVGAVHEVLFVDELEQEAIH